MNENNSIPLKLGSLASDVKEAVKATGLKRPDLLRLSIERGLPIVLKALGKQPSRPALNRHE